jgi:hypothetical protein
MDTGSNLTTALTRAVLEGPALGEDPGSTRLADAGGPPRTPRAARPARASTAARRMNRKRVATSAGELAHTAESLQQVVSQFSVVMKRENRSNASSYGPQSGTWPEARPAMAY